MDWGDCEWDYCPQCNRNFGGAAYPETQTSEELKDIKAVIDAIERAFANVRLERGTTIHEADLEGATQMIKCVLPVSLHE